MRTKFTRGLELVLVLVFVTIPLLSSMAQVDALMITDRSVLISTATPSAVASHNFQFTLTSPDSIGSIVFQYCSNSPLFQFSCTAPAGLSLSGAVLSEQSGNTGFSIDTNDSTASQLVISRTLAPALDVASSYTFSNVINPSYSNETTYVRISTYSSTDGTGSYIDNGAVAFSTSTNFSVGAYVPPFLNLCVGVTVAEDCAQATGNGLDFGILSSQTTASLTSQFSAATNSDSGLNVYLLGTTLTSGNNIIPAMVNQAPSQNGVSEFGINLRKNTDPPIGSDPIGNGTTTPSDGYNTPNAFSFIAGSDLASSSISTYYNLMTVSYIANVASSQPAGVYSTTVTYLAAAQF